MQRMVLTRAIFEEITWSDMRKILQERTHIYYFHSGDVLKEELKNKKIKEHEVTCSFQTVDKVPHFCVGFFYDKC